MKLFAKFISLLSLVFAISSCDSCDQRLNNLMSSGKPNRRVTIYSYNGEIIKSWCGKFETQMCGSAGIPYMKFEITDSTGEHKKIMIQGGIIINEEI